MWQDTNDYAYLPSIITGMAIFFQSEDQMDAMIG